MQKEPEKTTELTQQQVDKIVAANKPAFQLAVVLAYAPLFYFSLGIGRNLFLRNKVCSHLLGATFLGLYVRLLHVFIIDKNAELGSMSRKFALALFVLCVVTWQYCLPYPAWGHIAIAVLGAVDALLLLKGGLYKLALYAVVGVAVIDYNIWDTFVR